MKQEKLIQMLTVFPLQGITERERGLRMQAMSTTYHMSSNQVQNRRQVKSKEATSNRWMAKKTSR